jgi:hypothetical protein
VAFVFNAWFPNRNIAKIAQKEYDLITPVKNQINSKL